jgi:hypothetical protein
MSILYKIARKYGTQTDRHGYTLFGYEIEYFPNTNQYQISAR